MTDHIGNDEDRILRKISEFISSAYEKDFPCWARLLGNFRIVLIASGHPLYQHLDENSRQQKFNCLIFERDDIQVTVTHFGPFGKKKEDNFKDTLHKTDRSLHILKKAWEDLESPNCPLTETQKETERKEIRTRLSSEYWKLVEKINKKIANEKENLRRLIQEVCTSPEDEKAAEEMFKKLAASASKAALKTVLSTIVAEILEKITKKLAAKIAVKAGTKGALKSGSKSFGKSLPIVGLGLGAAFSLWRLSQNDRLGAKMELASGIASCAPGIGTGTSLAIDVALAGRDIARVMEHHKERAQYLRSEIERINLELCELSEKLEKAEEEYEYVQEVLQDPFDMKKLYYEISLLNEIVINATYMYRVA